MSKDVFFKIEELINSVKNLGIDYDRKIVLKPLIDYLKNKILLNQKINLNFICTHNSRRSQYCQVWAKVFSSFFNMDSLDTFSGGTLSTFVHPLIINSLIQVGFSVKKLTKEKNPIYLVKYSQNKPEIKLFSKKINHIKNPKNNFAAVLTCVSAERKCPIVYGSDIKITIAYKDPKQFDDSQIQEQEYLKTCYQIAREMFYVFSSFNNR
ncbi:MAG: protein-tyrosine-phosphatase [Flavobacteriaceae bacterium]|nr:protein-tyrosine-phosphatase [Flavobacteriaceae bacterium]